MKEISAPASAIHQNDFLVPSSFSASPKLGAFAAALAWAAAISLRGSRRVKAAAIASSSHGAPASRKAMRQPWASATRPPRARPASEPIGMPME